MNREEAEAQVLELIRLEDAKNFTLSITVDEGKWVIRSEDLDTGAVAIGRGATFEGAWFDQVSENLRSPK